MSQNRRIACYLILILFLCCIIQGELIWLEEIPESQILPEQNAQNGFEIYRDTLELVWEELVWFPVPESSVNEQATVAFENSWMAERNYGGKRSHEGTDLMASIDQAGYYPVVSITENKVDVVINAVSITDPERAQIEDIVKRKTEIGADGIVITLMDLEN